MNGRILVLYTNRGRKDRRKRKSGGVVKNSSKRSDACKIFKGDVE